MKKKLLTLILCALPTIQLHAIDIGGVVRDKLGGVANSVLGSLTDELFGDVNKFSQNLLEICYQPDINIGSGDICSLVDSIGSLQSDVCQIAPKIPGMRLKSHQVGLSGLRSLCNAKTKEFENIASKSAVSVIEGIGIDENQTESTLPNGKKLNEYLKSWNVKELAQDSTIYKYLSERKMDEIALFMDYSKFSNKDLNQITIEDVKAPATLEEYNNNVKESIKSFKDIANETSPTAIGQIIKGKVKDKKEQTATQSSNEYLQEMKRAFENAKNNEIAYTKAQYETEFPIPTQEYVKTYRFDLQPKKIAEIRRQQAKEIMLSKEIEEKWAKKYELSKLIADKEIILAQKFDKESAKAEIEAVVQSAEASSGGGGIGGILGH